MKARYVIVTGLAVLAAACSGTTPTVTPSSSAPTTVSTGTTVSTTSTTVATSSTSTTTSPSGQPPAVPHCYYTGSGYGLCEGIVLPMPGTVVLFTHPDKNGDFKLSGPAPLQTKDAVACGDLGCVYNHLDWSVFAKLVSGCKANTTSCEVNVQPRPSWTPVYVRQNNNPAILFLLWNSGKPGATITGYVRDKDEQGVENATVTASGGDGGSSPVDATTGYYAINVKAGQYTIAPAGGPSTVAPPRFEPASRILVLQAGDVGRADFTLNGGLKVSLGLSQSSVQADGSTVVKGEIRTTQFGKPGGGVTVVLRPKPEDSSDAAVTSGARATICGSTGTRIWPTGSLTSPFGTPVDVVTDANGVYDFTLTVGTVPGAFTLNAWAKNTAGQLITSDLNDTSPDRTLTITSPGNWTVSQLLPELAALKSDAQASQVLAAMTNDPASITQALSQLSGPGSKLGGLAYSVVNGASGGPAVFVYQDTSPPDVTATTGRVTVDDSALVLSPGLWVGTKLVALTTLNVVIQKGLLTAVPTYAQWTHGEAVPGWKLTANTASVSTYNFQYYGWAYPSTAAGACS